MVEDLVTVSGDQPGELLNRAYEVGASVLPVPPPVGNRRGTILTMGIIQIVLGSLLGVVALVLVLALPGPSSVKVLLGVVYSLPTVNLLGTGIGSVKLEGWARRATLVSAGIWLGLGLIATSGLLIATFVRGFGGVGGLGAGQGEGQLLSFAVLPMLLVWLALPIVLIALYTRPAVRATFERRAD